MAVNLTCTQVSALLSFYIDDKLSTQLKQFVEAHLQICPTCAAKYEALKSMITSLRAVHDRISKIEPEPQDDVAQAQYNVFKTNLSAYVDNELDDLDNIKVKKYVISNPKAREDLEKMYQLKKVMHNSFEKTRHEAKGDYANFVLKRIDIQEEIYGPDSFAKVVALFLFIVFAFALTAVVIFWV